MPLGQRLAQMLRVGRARRPKRASSYSSRRSSIAQILPDELILAILTHLSHDGLLGQHTYPISHIVEPSRAARAREAALCQQGLYAATLSCRSWYPVGIELLYSSPIILTKRKIELLLRTLTAHPHLADYVNDLYAPLIASKSPLAWLQNTLSIKSTSADTDDGAHLVTRLARTTSVLNALSLKHVVPSGHISTVPLFSLSSAFPSELEHLTIHGTSFESQNHPQFCLLPSHESNPLNPTSFDTLKTLCLRDMYILPTVKFPRMPHVERVALVQNHYFQSLTPVVNPDAPALLTADTFPSLRTLDIYGDEVPFASLARVADPNILYNLHAFTVVQALGHLQESLKLVSGAFDADNTTPSTPTSSTSGDSDSTTIPMNLRSLTIGVIGTMDTSALEKWHIPPTVERLTLLLSCGQPAYTRAEVNTLRRSQSLSPSLSRSRSHSPPQSYDPGEGRQLVRSVFKCLERNLRRNRGSGSRSGSGSLSLRELCLVVGPGVLSAPGDAEKVQSLCREGKTGLSVVYQDPDSCVAEMLVGMEARSTSTQMRLARIRSSDTTAKFVDVQHLDHYTPQELAV